MFRIKITLAFVLVSTAITIKAQSCSGCTITITSSDTASYTVNQGQVFCIDSTGKVTGSITLNGGTICNNGQLKPTTFSCSTGTIINRSYAYLPGNISLNTGVTIYSERRSFLRVDSNLTVNGGLLHIKGIANIKNNLIYSAGSFTNAGVVNCREISVSTGSITNTGILNKR